MLLDTALVPDLSAAEEIAYAQAVNELYAKMQGKAAIVKAAWMEHRVNSQVAKGADGNVVGRQLEARGEGPYDIYGGEEIVFADSILGCVSVTEILRNPLKFDGKPCADPNEGPEYGKTTAKFWWNNGKPCINSFAHGGCQYFLHESMETIPSEESVAAAEEIKKTAIGMIASILQREGFEAQYTAKIESAILSVPMARCVGAAFWQPERAKAFMFKNTKTGEDLVTCSEKDFPEFCSNIFGALYYSKLLDEIIAKYDVSKNDAKLIRQAAYSALLMYLKLNHQRSSLQIKVDMFATEGRMEMMDEHVCVIYTHKPFSEGVVDADIIADYKAHFPEFDEVIDFIIYSRFAADRKNSYLWILAVSDWGKGLLMGAFKLLNIAVELSVKETEALMEGKPAGKSPKDFKRAFVTVFDEFKTVKSELKQLQSEISLAPKHQLSCTVEVFVKLFLSAESVESLIGSHGVEDQFCNRMSIIRGEGTIVSRAKFIEVGSAKYCESIANYIARKFNRKVAMLVSMGRDGATKYAGEQLGIFHHRYGIGNHFGRLSDSVPEIANSILDGFLSGVTKYPVFNRSELAVGINDGHLVMKSPSKVIDDWISANEAVSEQIMLKRKKSEIIKALSVDNAEQSKPYYCSWTKKAIKGIRLKPTDERITKIIKKLGADLRIT
jgi:hypothetical protein